MAFCSSEYFHTTASVQKSMHEREKRRHELEQELFAYTRSEERLAKLKCVKMRYYHRELCKREQQAKARNLELLRSVESLISKANELSSDFSALHHLKLECRHHITRLLEKSEKESEKQLEAPKGNNLQEYGTSIPPSTGQSSQHAATVTGQQALHDLSVECRVLSTHLPCLTGPMPDHSSTPHTQRKRLPSAARHFAAHEHGPGQPASPCETSQASAESSYHGTVSGSLLQHHLNQSPSPDSRHSRGPARFGGSGEQDRGAGGGAEVEAESPRKCPDIPERRQNGSPSTLSIPSSDVAVTPQPSLNTDSNVSVSFSDSLHEPRSPGGGAPPPGRNSTPCMGRRTPEDTVQPGGPPSSNPEHRLSLDGLFYLLDSIEEHLPARDTELYSSPAVCEQKLRDIISRSDGHCRIRREELASCGAVVLQQLPCLARSMPQRCLLPSSLVHTYWSTAADAAQIRSCLAGDSALLWERWLTHVCRLLRLDVLPLERALRLFTPLLVCEGASYTDKAEELLKRLLTHVAETGLSSESEESSSCSLPSLLRDGPEIRPGRHSKNPATQEVQSGEEDSADQSPVESIPIRETKAYQLLKQSVTQETQQKSRQEEEEENNTSDLEPSGVSDIEKPKRETLIQDSRKDPKRKVQAFSAVQSKAFWGDSDDSNSDIEMALRPQPHNTNDDDFDDFYD
ncbi:centrosomal protein kizuna isoform X3 [Electrophorus electricus]|uniref:centrosomal protein kizuna isoform X3 n=1 Tax=Electrophorus electricus TaxID=8005 RepID=UPI0015D0A5D2|nr:centrosomal protein kizuna isoform X3 [Electrophorus electricus]